MYSYLALAGAASALVAPSTPTRPRTALHAQTAEFAQPLWGRDNFDDVTTKIQFVLVPWGHEYEVQPFSALVENVRAQKKNSESILDQNRNY